MADYTADDLSFVDAASPATAAPVPPSAVPVAAPKPAPGAAPAPAWLASVMVMIVDDQRTVRKIVRKMLEEAGIAWIAEASGGQGALDLLNAPHAPKPDIIITDLMMEGVDGLGLLQAVRLSKDHEIKQIPMIVLTASDDAMIRDIASDLGSACVLGKPSSRDEIIAAVADATGAKRLA